MSGTESSEREERDAQAFRERLERAAEDYEYTVREREEGVVRSVGDGVARVDGLSEVRLDEVVRIDERVDALAFDLGEDDVGLVVLGSEEDVRVGARVRGTGTVVSVPVGEKLLGRVLDPLGNPLDGEPAPEATERWPVERAAPGIADRDPVTEPLITGITVVDALFPIGRGQRELVIGDRGTGKSTLVTDTIINQRDTDVRCVYASVGQQTASVVALLETLREADAMDNTTVVVAPSDAPAGMRYLAPYAACSIAEYFRDRGEHALVVFDDLSRHAVAYRELALLLRRPPGREAYPGDIFFIHSRLLERATRLTSEHGGGTLTALPVAETQAGRISGFIPTNLISITDGQLYLDPEQFDRGVKPAVDIGLSVSRVGGKTQRPSMKEVAKRLRLDAARFREVEVFSRFGTRVEEGTRKALVRGERIREVLKQGPGAPIPLGEQVAVLLALDEGAFDELDTEQVRGAARRLREALRGEQPDMLQAFGRGEPPDDEHRGIVRETVRRESGERGQGQGQGQGPG